MTSSASSRCTAVLVDARGLSLRVASRRLLYAFLVSLWLGSYLVASNGFAQEESTASVSTAGSLQIQPIKPSQSLDSTTLGSNSLALACDIHEMLIDDEPLISVDGDGEVSTHDSLEIADDEALLLDDESSCPTADDPASDDNLRDADQVWMISSRQIGCPTCDDSGLVYRQLEDRTWNSSSAEVFDASLDHPLPTVVFVHGNRTDLSYANKRGLQAYRAFIESNPNIGPVRFLVWAWPSEQDAIGVRDFRNKADRADLEGCLFGTFLTRLPRDQTLNLIGYSYGSRIVLGGVSMLTGHTLHGRRVSLPSDYSPPPIRVTLIAAAVPPSSLLPGQLYGHAYPLIDRLLLVNNSEDRALKLYRFVDRVASVPALGSTGLAVRRLVDAGARVTQCDVGSHVGPQHKIDLYFASSVVGRLVHEQLSWSAHVVTESSPIDSGSSP